MKTCKWHPDREAYSGARCKECTFESQRLGRLGFKNVTTFEQFNKLILEHPKGKPGGKRTSLITTLTKEQISEMTQPEIANYCDISQAAVWSYLKRHQFVCRRKGKKTYVRKKQKTSYKKSKDVVLNNKHSYGTIGSFYFNVRPKSYY